MNIENDLLIKVSQLYYVEELNQSEIANELGIHRSTISRLLRVAKERKIVNISIDTSSSELNSLAKEVENKYGITKVITVPTTPGMSNKYINTTIIKRSSDYIASLIESDNIIGFSWGRAMAALSENFPTPQVDNVLCVPLIGGPAGRLESDFHVNNITFQASKKIGGKALMIDFPAFPENKEIKDSLVKDEYFNVLSQSWKNVDIAFFGIGSPILKKSKQWQSFYGSHVFQDIFEEDVAGDIVSRFFTYSGSHLDNPLDEIIIGITHTDLLEIPIKICVAESIEKVDAIDAALKGKYIDVLLTTQEVASKLLSCE